MVEWQAINDSDKKLEVGSIKNIMQMTQISFERSNEIDPNCCKQCFFDFQRLLFFYHKNLEPKSLFGFWGAKVQKGTCVHYSHIRLIYWHNWIRYWTVIELNWIDGNVSLTNERFQSFIEEGHSMFFVFANEKWLRKSRGAQSSDAINYYSRTTTID